MGATERADAAPDGGRGATPPLPGPDELYAVQRAAGLPERLLEIGDGDDLLARIPVREERRTLRGVPLRLLVTPGDDFFDYLPSPFRPGTGFAALRRPLRRALAGSGADALLLPHLLAPLPEGSEAWQDPFANRYFDAGRADKGWAGLTGKDSLRRHRNRARRELAYRVEHIAGRLPADLLARIAELHRERWAFDGVRSLFADPARPAQYQACAQRALLTLVFDGEALLAAHIGLRFGETLIWHTPVINLRYLAWSPLEVLLLETAEECARTGVRVLDFGLGDEAYKSRFANALRPVVNLFVPCSWRGRLVHCLLRRDGLRGLRRRLAALRAKLSGAWPAERDVWLLPPAGGTLPSCPDAPLPEAVGDFSRLVDLFRAAGWPLRRAHHERLRRGGIFLALPAGEVAGNGPAGIWWQAGDALPGDAARCERHLPAPSAILHDFTGATPRHGASWLALLSPDVVRRLIPAAAAVDLRIRLRRDERALRAILLAAGCRSG